MEQAYDFKNTLELEQSHLLDVCEPDTKVHICGGLDKSKYNTPKYINRTTYTANELKIILKVLNQIESSVNPNLSQLQKAYFVHQILSGYISYDHNYTDHHDKASNLSGLISGKSVCAGYSLIYKEIMDRLGIKCDYVHGNGSNEMHAWNTLLIDDAAIAVDLTWNSSAHKNSVSKVPPYFGNSNDDFYSHHTPDADEVKYDYTHISSHNIKKLDASVKENNQISYNTGKTITPLMLKRKSGSKLAISQCDSIDLNGEKIYKYIISECCNGGLEPPKIIYSENNIKNLSEDERQNFASVLLSPQRLNRYFEHCEDEMRYSPQPDKFENHGGYVGYMDGNIKKVDDLILNNFKNNFSTMSREDGTSFVVQLSPSNKAIKKLNLNTYDIYEMSLNKNGEPELIHDTIYSEQDLLNIPHNMKNFVSSVLLSRDRINEKSDKFKGYVGYVEYNQQGKLSKFYNDKISKRIHSELQR